jgi:O-antigen/teichoic acid export membrane protein
LKSKFFYNVTSNYVGTVWSALIQLMLVPIYIKLLGVESYGLIGFYVTLQAVIQVLDLGLSPTINREMARSSAMGAPGREIKDIVKTLECIYWGTGAAIGIAIALLSTFLATRWLNVQTLPLGDVKIAIALMGLVVAFQWPMSFYTGGLLGLQRQALVNGLNVLFSTVSGLGAVAVLMFVSPSVSLFFIWRAGMVLVQVLITRIMLWRSFIPLEDRVRPIFRLESLSQIWRFSLGMTGISLTSVMLIQADKVILSKILTMEHFGYYMLATSVANFLPQLVSPIFVAVFPGLSKLVVTGDVAAQKQQFHFCAQLITVIVHPIALTFIFFSNSIITLWTRNEALAAYSSTALSFLAVGAILNSIMVLPYALQLAHGWTKLGVTINVVLVCFMIPYTIVAAKLYGVQGAASTWILLNTIYVIVGAPLTMRRLLPGEGWRWFGKDVISPIFCILAAVSLVWFVMPRQGSTIMMVTTLIMSVLISYTAALAACGQIRRRLLEQITHRWSQRIDSEGGA